ncbi:MAG: hypothetical protein WA162_07995, partial [Thermodesulfobacteriota bacterium]
TEAVPPEPGVAPSPPPRGTHPEDGSGGIKVLPFYKGETEGIKEVKEAPVKKTYLSKYLYTVDGSVTGTRFSNLSRLYYDRYRDELYAIDSGNRRFVVIGSDGVLLYSFTFDDAGLKGYPSSISVNKEGLIYAAEEARISILDYRGVFKKELDLSALPVKTSIQSLAVDDDGRIYIGMVGVLAVMDKNGKFLFEIKPEDGAGFVNSSKIAVTSRYIYILDPAMFLVYRFARDGKYISNFGKISGLAGGFSMPVDFGVDEKSGLVAVLDINRYAAMFYAPDGEFLYEFGGTTAMPRPNALALGSAGTFFVVTVNSGLIRAFQVLTQDVIEPKPATPAEIPQPIPAVTPAETPQAIPTETPAGQ